LGCYDSIGGLFCLRKAPCYNIPNMTRMPNKKKHPPSRPRDQLGWTLVGWLNAIAIAVIVVAVWQPPLTAWWILGGGLVAIAVPVLFLWHGLRK